MAYVLGRRKPNLTFPTLTGSIVTFNSQYALPLKSHTIALTATQSGSGTPSPQNIRSINGWSEINVSATASNLWGGAYMLRTFIKMNLDSTFGYNEQELHYGSGAMSGYKEIIAENFKPNTQYTLILSIKKSSANTSTNLSVLYTDNTRQILNFPAESDATVKQTLVFTTTQNKTVKAITGANGGGITYLYYNECCLLEGVKTVDDFEPFGTYTTIQIGSTVYGGEYDAITGILTVTHGFVTYDSNNVPFMQIGTISGGVKTRVFIRQSGISQDVSGVPDMLCNIANPVEVNAQYQGNEGISIRVNANVNNQGFYIYDEDIQTLTEWQDYINNNSITVVYPLATPTTIQLPPCPIETLLGVNNVWADTGDTTLQYPKFG